VYCLPSIAEGLPVGCIEAVAAGLGSVISSTVTKDISSPYPDRIVSLPLNAPLDVWSASIESAIAKHLPFDDGLKLVAGTPFDFNNFAERFIEIYEKASR
jgi:hypothetical protein